MLLEQTLIIFSEVRLVLFWDVQCSVKSKTFQPLLLSLKLRNKIVGGTNRLWMAGLPTIWLPFPLGRNRVIGHGLLCTGGTGVQMERALGACLAAARDESSSGGGLWAPNWLFCIQRTFPPQTCLMWTCPRKSLLSRRSKVLRYTASRIQAPSVSSLSPSFVTGQNDLSDLQVLCF